MIVNTQQKKKLAQIKKVLSAPLSMVAPALRSEKNLFPEGTTGAFYTFELSSGQVFIGNIPEKGNTYTFRTFCGPFPQLYEIRWTPFNSINVLNYHTECRFLEKPLVVIKRACLDALEPKRDNSPKPLTKIAFEYYHYHPLLDRAILLQQAHQNIQEAQRRVASCKNHLKALMITSNKPKIYQQQTKGEKQHVRN
jgi:hypothetical protein